MAVLLGGCCHCPSTSSAPAHGIAATRASSVTPAPKPVALAGQGAAPVAPRPVAATSVRQAGLNYVVIQSYPTRPEAEAAVQLLAREGVAATVESNLRGWGADWFSVMGTRGFGRISGPEYEAYLAQIRTVSDKYAPVPKFKQFAPTGYKWGT